jgi:hyperosmotically inducible protein
MKNMFIAFLLGVIVGAAGYWFMLQRPVQSPAQQAAERVRQKAAEAGKAAGGAAEDAKQAIAAKLEALQLRAADISEELKQTGRVVRHKARDIGEAAAGAASDTRITAEVKRKLLADPDLSSLSISVNTTDGRVTLSGKVASAGLVGRAMLLAMETDGVREVVSTLQVPGAAAPAPANQS